MRTFLFLVVALCLMDGEMCQGSNKYSEVKLIRRAYLDVIGVVPTVDEIEWYTVYNNNGYDLAVNYLTANKHYKWTVSRAVAREILISSDYASIPATKLTEAQITSIVCYVIGKKVGEITLIDAKRQLIENARLCSINDSEMIDYICNALMSRDSNLEEINMLTKYLNAHENDKDVWINIINQIIQFDDFLLK